jgi:phosphatidylglycerophosphate synthase
LNKPAESAIKFTLNVPNILTTIRIILAIIVVTLLALGNSTQVLAAGIILGVAAVTDFFDGFLARKLGQTSLFGSLYDIVADEILFMPTLIVAVISGLFDRTAGMVWWNPYLYAGPALLGGVTVVAGVVIYIIKRRKRVFEFPTPTKVAKMNYWFWIAPLFLAIINVGPDLLLAVLMYAALVSTIATFYSYLKKGSYVFTGKV